ncbi:Lipase [Lachnellula suecica]|uniref:Lipase n=1 Tax=Lachnellula suecica TaxID=602035 RepID=A0A8T9C9P7_9HELO|nr:Lipase [Lachnellula suecica]
MRLSFQYTWILCLGLAYAAPLVPRDGASYCFGNVKGNASKISCPASAGGSCLLVESAQTTIVQNFTLGKTKTTGFVAVDDTNKLVVVSIQGTAIRSNPIDIVTDIDAIRVNTDLCGNTTANDGCEIHQGFWNAMNDVQDIVKSTIAGALATHPNYTVISTGHSLGGAVAALLGATLRNNGTNVDIYTYGQPKLGTVDVSNFIQNQAPSKGSNYRVTHFNDIVPQLPPHSIDDWDHYYPEFFINLDTGAPKATDIIRVDATLFSTAGNEGKTTGDGIIADVIAGISAHRQYFGNISRCDPSAPDS